MLDFSSREVWTADDQHLRHSLSGSKHGLFYFVAFGTYFVKLSHSFLKQCCNSQSVAVSELDILDVRSLEGQGALFVLWPQCQKRLSLLLSLLQSSLSSMVTPSDFAVVTWLTWKWLIASVGDSVRVLSLCLDLRSLNSVLVIFRVSLFAISQLWKFSKSLFRCNWVLSAWSLSTVYV